MARSPQLSAPLGPQLSDRGTARHPDELHVLVTGLDPLAATATLLLADVGVCLLNVSDSSPVTARDSHTGPYPDTLTGSPREYALRKLLRNRWPRCVPLSAPELFCSSQIPTAVMLRSASVDGPLPRDLSAIDHHAAPDEHLPVVTVITDGSASLTWPISPWYRRPCRECMVGAVQQARKILREQPPLDPGSVATPHFPALTALTRVVTATDIVAQLMWHAGLGSGLAGPGLAGPGIAEPGVAGPGIAEPGVAGPGFAGPGVAVPGIAGPVADTRSAASVASVASVAEPGPASPRDPGPVARHAPHEGQPSTLEPPAPEPPGPPAPESSEPCELPVPPVQLTLRYGLHRTTVEPTAHCLCTLDG